MNKMKCIRRRLLPLLSLLLVLLLTLGGCGLTADLLEVGGGVYDKPVETALPAPPTAIPQPGETDGGDAAAIDEDGSYTSRDDVALYLHTYGRLPQNFITKSAARAAGWEGGSLEAYFPGCCIGGDRFGNYEGLLPQAEGRSYTECDIDTLGASSRGAKRIVYSSDGLIYYTDDHYETFTLLYGEE